MSEASGIGRLRVPPRAKRGEVIEIRLLLQHGQVEHAKTAFAPVAGKAPTVRKFEALQHWFNAIESGAVHADAAGAQAGFDAKLAADKRDFDTRYALAQLHMSQQRWVPAMDELLEIVMRDKAWNGEAARKTYVAMLTLMAKPAPKAAAGEAKGALEVTGKAAAVSADPVLDAYRRKLSMALF